ncbi:MAG: sigma-54 factor interaction domain-containing protein [Sphingomonadales bacterium]
MPFGKRRGPPEGAENDLGLAGESPQIKEVRELARTAAASGYSVLIQGETGVGKEVLARAIHRLSPRAKAPFVTQDCGAIPTELLEGELFGHEVGAYTGTTRSTKGRFRSAHNGILFLDEVGNLSLVHQAKLLRALETHSVRPLGADKSVKVPDPTSERNEGALWNGEDNGG